MALKPNCIQNFIVNYRAAQYLINEGLYDFLNWFDGRILFTSLSAVTESLHRTSVVSFGSNCWRYCVSFMMMTCDRLLDMFQNSYPGLMLTSGLAWRLLHYFNLPIHIREVCVFIVPWMASNTTLAAYFLAKGLFLPRFRVHRCACNGLSVILEIKDSSAGLLAAAFIGIVPGTSRRCVVCRN